MIDSFFETLLADTRNMAHLPLRLYSGEDCYETESAPEVNWGVGIAGGLVHTEYLRLRLPRNGYH